MARIEFPRGLEGSENLPRTKKTLQNCFNNGNGSIISRPGIQELNTTGAVARGSFVWNKALYQVVSQDLIKITDTDTGAFSVIGTIDGPENIDHSIGFNFAVIVVKGATGRAYTLSKTDVLTQITDVDFKSSISVANINGRTVYIPFDGSPAFFSDVGAPGNIDPLSFFDAEELPDDNNAVFNFKNTLYIMGTDSIELFRDTGASPNPFLRIDGSRILNGFIGGLLEYNNTFLFIGREKDQDFGIYSIGQGIAPKISNERIDLILSTYTQGELAEAIPGRIKWRGYDIATFSLRRDSFAFFGGNWFKLDTVFDGVSRPWGGGFITQFEGEYFTAFSDKIGRFAKINSDYGNRITRIMETGLSQTDTDFLRVQSIELGISQGFNPQAVNPGSVALFLSDNNIIFGPPLYRSLGNLGQYNHKLIWNYAGGMGTYRGFIGIKFFTTENIDFSDDYIVARAS